MSSERKPGARGGVGGGGRIDWAPAGLWASAFVLAGLILAQASGAFDARADAAGVAGPSLKADGISAITVDAGNYDALFVIQDKSEQLLVYTVTDQDGLQLRLKQNLPALFTGARIRARGN